MVAAIPIITAVAGGLSAISTISGLFGGKSKAPAAVTPPPAPTVNQAAQQAGQDAIANQRKGALANLLQPSSSQQASTSNTSLKTVLGG